MRRKNRDQRAETARLRALAHGSLIDVSDTARIQGIQLPVAISRSLWTSLVLTFPSARASDYCSLENMLGQLMTVVELEYLNKEEYRYSCQRIDRLGLAMPSSSAFSSTM